MRRIFIAPDGRPRSGWALLLFLVAFTALSAALGAGLHALGLRRLAGGMLLGDPALLPAGLARLAAPLLATWVGCLAMRQRLGEAGLGDPRWGPRLGVGVGLGAAALSASIALTWLAGQAPLSGPTGSAGGLAWAGLIQLAVLIPISAGEEISLRGFLLQQLARGLSGLSRRLLSSGKPRLLDPEHASQRFGSTGAVLLTGTLFGLLHGLNPGSSRLAVLNVILVGLWLGVLVVKSGSLWMAIGVHAGWNWFQGFVWGAPVSGLKTGTSLLHLGPGAPLWTGGDFGPEASAVTSIVLAAMLLGTLAWKPRRSAPSLPEAR